MTVEIVTNAPEELQILALQLVKFLSQQDDWIRFVKEIHFINLQYIIVVLSCTPSYV